MAQVIATSKHGQLQPQIGGVRFFSSPHGRISEEISDEQAEQFLLTPDHFKRHLGEAVETPAPKKAAAQPKAQAPAGKAATAAAESAVTPNF